MTQRLIRVSSVYIIRYQNLKPVFAVKIEIIFWKLPKYRKQNGKLWVYSQRDRHSLQYHKHLLLAVPHTYCYLSSGNTEASEFRIKL